MAPLGTCSIAAPPSEEAFFLSVQLESLWTQLGPLPLLMPLPKIRACLSLDATCLEHQP